MFTPLPHIFFFHKQKSLAGNISAKQKLNFTRQVISDISITMQLTVFLLK